MRQFFHDEDRAYLDLEQKARRGCVVFPDQEMPPGTNPSRLRIGFEINPDTEAASLLVDHGATYSGPSEEFREWLGNGQKQFASFSDLRTWLVSVAKSEFAMGGSEPTEINIENLTDRSRVAELSKVAAGPKRIDAGQLADKLALQIRGQHDALQRLSKKVSQHFMRRSPRRPATLFALGPTGVGKTQTAELLPSVLRKLDGVIEELKYLRLDMSEYGEKHRVSQLLGSPQGYIGYGDGSQLIDTLTAHPNSIILFDEIEKAHPAILQTLMNAMDAGRLSTAYSRDQVREIDCRKSIFFFTSNVEADEILNEIESRNAFENPLLTDEICRKHLKRSGLKAELIGRISCFLVFKPLSDETRTEVMALGVVRVAREYGLNVLRIAPETIVSLVTKANRKEFGARPDEYLIEEVLGPTFAREAELRPSVPVEVIGTSNYQCLPLKP